ncbi:unnamed protein product, partial [Musa acuminata var. zebrina]
GLYRWNNVLRSRQKPSTRSSSTVVKSKGMEGGDERATQSEESLRLVMYLSCWGPN